MSYPIIYSRTNEFFCGQLQVISIPETCGVICPSRGSGVGPPPYIYSFLSPDLQGCCLDNCQERHGSGGEERLHGESQALGARACLCETVNIGHSLGVNLVLIHMSMCDFGI